jgi:hypothetical protein
METKEQMLHQHRSLLRVIPSVDLIVCITDSSEVPVAVATLRQIYSEQNSDSFRITRVVLPNSCLSEEDLKAFEVLPYKPRGTFSAAETHAASFNVGVRYLSGMPCPADYLIRLDGNCRLAVGAFSRLIKAAHSEDLSVAFPHLVSAPSDSRLNDDQVLAGLVEDISEQMSGEVDPLQMSLEMTNGLVSAGLPAGLFEGVTVVSRVLVEELMQSTGRRVFTEAPGGSAAARLFAVLFGTRHQRKVARVHVPVFCKELLEPRLVPGGHDELEAFLCECGLLGSDESFTQV